MKDRAVCETVGENRRGPGSGEGSCTELPGVVCGGWALDLKGVYGKRDSVSKDLMRAVGDHISVAFQKIH